MIVVGLALCYIPRSEHSAQIDSFRACLLWPVDRNPCVLMQHCARFSISGHFAPGCRSVTPEVNCVMLLVGWGVKGGCLLAEVYVTVTLLLGTRHHIWLLV